MLIVHKHSIKRNHSCKSFVLPVTTSNKVRNAFLEISVSLGILGISAVFVNCLQDKEIGVHIGKIVATDLTESNIDFLSQH